MKKNRIRWVDLAKGIAILLVIIGHTVDNKVIIGVIYSFHMPLFFILSGYTATLSLNKTQLLLKFRKAAKSLLLLVYIIWLIRLPAFYFTGRLNYSFIQIILSGVFASASKCYINTLLIPEFGMGWFLVALFFLRSLYDWIQYMLQGKYMTTISLIITALGVTIGQRVYLPFSLDIVMASFGFYHVGQLMKQHSIKPSLPLFGGSLLCWGGE